uniref:Uncharacterized protein n=1 Tax=Nelumbo nucifera TaxID=4432 RepID=A0A822ZNV2_NELNU|nr:TPA_asm: hypothetical protein HUJ06_017601 [Nelumbo nucifera]
MFGRRFLIKSTGFITSRTSLSRRRNPLTTNGVACFRFLSVVAMQRRMPDPDDPYTLMKEDGVAVCSEMWIESFREPGKTVTNLTFYLRRFELWVLAYQKVCADETGSYMPRSAIQKSDWKIC